MPRSFSIFSLAFFVNPEILPTSCWKRQDEWVLFMTNILQYFKVKTSGSSVCYSHEIHRQIMLMAKPKLNVLHRPLASQFDFAIFHSHNPIPTFVDWNSCTSALMIFLQILSISNPTISHLMMATRNHFFKSFVAHFCLMHTGESRLERKTSWHQKKDFMTSRRCVSRRRLSLNQLFFVVHKNTIRRCRLTSEIQEFILENCSPPRHSDGFLHAAKRFYSPFHHFTVYICTAGADYCVEGCCNFHLLANSSAPYYSDD